MWIPKRESKSRRGRTGVCRTYGTLPDTFVEYFCQKTTKTAWFFHINDKPIE